MITTFFVTDREISIKHPSNEPVFFVTDRRISIRHRCVAPLYSNKKIIESILPGFKSPLKGFGSLASRTCTFFYSASALLRDFFLALLWDLMPLWQKLITLLKLPSWLGQL